MSTAGGTRDRLTGSVEGMKNLKGANAILTGASRGLGVLIAKALADEGVNLVLAARSADALEKVKIDVEAKGVRAIAVPTDVCDRAALENLVAKAEAEFGTIDILVNNAGIEAMHSYDLYPEEEILELMAVNLTAPMLLTRRVLPGMLRRNAGSIVNVASLAGKGAVPYQVPYSTSKGGLVHFTHTLRAELVDTNIKCSVICPGFVADEGMYADMVKDTGIKAPKVLGESPPEDVAEAVVKAVRKGSSELIVNPSPMRPLLALQQLWPDIAPRMLKLMGVTALDEEGRGGAGASGRQGVTRHEVVLFDLGGVLIRLGGVGPMGRLAGIDSEEEVWRRWLSCRWVRDFERGWCSNDEFAAGVVADWKLPISPADFLELFGSWPEGTYDGAEQLVSDVSARARVGCISNTNALHWAIYETWPISNAFELSFLSHKLGLVKPDRELFQHVAGDIAVEPAKVVFLDDNEVNVSAARDVGFTAIRVRGVEEAARRARRPEPRLDRRRFEDDQWLERHVLHWYDPGQARTRRYTGTLSTRIACVRSRRSRRAW